MVIFTIYNLQQGKIFQFDGREQLIRIVHVQFLCYIEHVIEIILEITFLFLVLKKLINH